MAGMAFGRGTSLDLLRSLPRVSLANLKPSLNSRKRERRPRDRRRGRKCGRGHKGERQRGTRPRLGFEGGQTPFYIRIPKYGFNEGHSFRHQYQPLSLRRLQYLIDLGRVDPTQPIDLTQLVNGRGVTIQPLKRDYGVQLVEEYLYLFLKHLFRNSVQACSILSARTTHSKENASTRGAGALLYRCEKPGVPGRPCQVS
ncbi:39S ribosomal protein L15, mitochondrial isoform 4 [Rattus norvegicus]|uniref:Mitochondrial ribosomal protein L15 n=1 Tax=Rattus norvegicus TaxID=10116 RepID=A0A0G2K9B4_RAT|nr:39S ribosomal protein L15, mitochondrial isoform 4 [Rattus norvegicus]